MRKCVVTNFEARSPSLNVNSEETTIFTIDEGPIVAKISSLLFKNNPRKVLKWNAYGDVDDDMFAD